MKTLFQAASEVQAFFLDRGWRFCFMGGIAIQRWGEPRLTVDIDVTLLTGFGAEEQYVDALCERYIARIPDARDFALKNRVLLLEAAPGIPLDIAFGAVAFEELPVGRATDFAFLEDVRFCGLFPSAFPRNANLSEDCWCEKPFSHPRDGRIRSRVHIGEMRISTERPLGLVEYTNPDPLRQAGGLEQE